MKAEAVARGVDMPQSHFDFKKEAMRVEARAGLTDAKQVLSPGPCIDFLITMAELRCRKCRYVFFYFGFIIYGIRCVMLHGGEDVLPPHDVDSNSLKPKVFLQKDIKSNAPGVGRPVITMASCTHIFTGELPWMESFIRDVPEGVVRWLHLQNDLMCFLMEI